MYTLHEIQTCLAAFRKLVNFFASPDWVILLKSGDEKITESGDNHPFELNAVLLVDTKNNYTFVCHDFDKLVSTQQKKKIFYFFLTLSIKNLFHWKIVLD